MKLFGDFEAVKFPEENIIFVTRNEHLYYIYKANNQTWKKYYNAGNEMISIKNYPDIDRNEMVNAMGGSYPTREEDFMRLCNPSQLWVSDLMDLLEKDFPKIMVDYDIYGIVQEFLCEANLRDESYEKIRKLLEQVDVKKRSKDEIIAEIKKFSFETIGRDIFKREIGIVDGHNGMSYFWIMPVRFTDSENIMDWYNVSEMESNEISIEEDDVYQYLTPFLYKYFDETLYANKKRIDNRWTDDEGNEQVSLVKGFEWNLTYNFYTYDAMSNILADINDTINALTQGYENEYTPELKKKLVDVLVDKYDTDVNMLIDFYQRFTYRIEYMMRVGEEKGYNFISFMGP